MNPEELLPHCEVIRVEPGDVIVYRHPTRLKQTEAENLHRCMRQLFPSNMIGIMDDGGKIEIVRGDDAEA